MCAVLLLLSACAGGGGSGTSTASATSPAQATAQPTLGSNIADQLRKALGQDSTFNVEQSDANASHGPKIGQGSATRAPDLMHYQMTASSNGSTFNWEQVIDYANAMVYSRLGTGGQWGQWYKKAGAIAHFYDLQNPKVLGTETVSGVPTYHIRGTVVSGGLSTTLDVWARTDTLRAVQIWQAYKVQSQTAYFFFVITAYDTGVTINVPTDASSL